MSITVLGALYNAQENFKPIGTSAKNNPILIEAWDQLNRAITALENGAGVNDEIQTHTARLRRFHTFRP